jgi:beta-phosphoglucomutase-like phosphatase (HAD superfamily)
MLTNCWKPCLAAGASQAANRALMAAVAATLDVPASRCLALASSSDLVNSAAAAGMVAVAIPRKMAYSASYPAAVAKFEGFGPGYATFGRLQSLLQATAAAPTAAAVEQQ